MANYHGTAGTPERAKALAAVVLVHAGLAALILTGLHVRAVQQGADALKTFDIDAPQPPQPPPPPPPEKQAERPKDQEGAAGKKAVPKEIVAPKVQPISQPKILAAPVASTGSASTAGAAASGTGTGAGGSGNGLGGGGTGAPDYSRFTPALLVRNLSRGDYRQMVDGRTSRGTAILSLRVRPDGTADECRILRSSNDFLVDNQLCALVTDRLRFRPARDDRGRPIAYQFEYAARWNL